MLKICVHLRNLWIKIFVVEIAVIIQIILGIVACCRIIHPSSRKNTHKKKDNPLAKTNYQYEKRQKELEKKKKKNEKLQRKQVKKNVTLQEKTDQPAEK